MSLKEIVKRAILSEMENCNNNKSQVARNLQISHRTIRNYLHTWGMDHLVEKRINKFRDERILKLIHLSKK